MTQVDPQRAVAFLDILGFKHLVETSPLRDLAKRYEEALGQAISVLSYPATVDRATPRLFPDHPSGRAWCERYWFSDSLILVSHTDEDGDVLKLLIFCWRLVQVLLVAGFPLRGCIVIGPVHSKESANMVLGQGLIDAWQQEQQQDWIGVMIAPKLAQSDAMGRILNRHRLLNGVFPEWSVPMKAGPELKTRVVNWRAQILAEDGIRASMPEAPDSAAQRKIEHAMRFSAAMRKRFAYSADPKSTPLELAYLQAAGPGSGAWVLRHGPLPPHSGPD